jgi:hypothetical protein
MTNPDAINPTWEYTLRRRRRRLLVLLIAIALVAALGAWLFYRLRVNRPVDFADDRNHFLYGSIGSEEGHLPYRLWRVLPQVFPEHLPANRAGEGYARFGFIFEAGQPVPIGFSRRRARGLDLVGLNCAACHCGTVRETSDAAPQVVLGMPAHRLDVEEYFRFLFRCAEDERFNAEFLLAAIDRDGGLGPLERLVTKAAIPQAREGILGLRWRLRYLGAATDSGLRDESGRPVKYPDWGPGRVDTTNALKSLRLGYDMTQERWVSFNDLPSIWNQEPRRSMGLHWDGNNSSLDERNLSAAMGAGAFPSTLDLPRIERVARWSRALPPPDYPFPIDAPLAAAGKPIYDRYCKACHSFSGAEVGRVTPLAEIGTDPHRFHSASPPFITDANKLGSTELNAFLPRAYRLRRDEPWRFSHFHKTVGYANVPLDGVWARAPYLHNGSVPTMRDLLKPPGDRPSTFWKGSDVYHQRDMGFVSDEGGDNYFEFQTSLPGNDNGGHEYGTTLSTADQDALIEYLKTLGAAK